MNIFLVTGSAGFIGFHLSRRLLELGHTVIGYDNINDYYDQKLKHMRLDILKEYPKFTFYHNDLCDYGALENAVKDNQVSFIIHLAAQAGVRYSLTHPEKYIESNIIGTFHVLEVCRHCGIKQLMYASSSSVYGNSAEEKLNTDQFTDKPISLYAATKKSNEVLAHVYSDNFKINTLGMRFFTVYGPYGRPDMAYFEFTRKLYGEEEIEIYNYGNQYRDFTYIDDLIDGVAGLIRLQELKEINGDYRIYNIGNGNPVKLMRFVNTLEDITGKKAITKFCGKKTGDVERTYADISELQKATGFQPHTDIEEGLRKFHDWYRLYVTEGRV
jgi:UDP-glucuronate 4-epimerase